MTDAPRTIFGWLAERHGVFTAPGAVFLGLHELAHMLRLLTPENWHHHLLDVPSSVGTVGLVLLIVGFFVRALRALEKRG